MCPGQYVRDILLEASSPRVLVCHNPRLARVRTRGYSPPNECVLTSGKYRKTHIPGTVAPRWEGLNILEKRYFALGNLGFPVFALPQVRLGALICYDRRFSEGYRALALGGAELICVPYNTPTFGQPREVGQETSEVLLRAATMENQLFIVAVGKAGVEDGAEYIGGSEVIAPTGRVVAKAQTDGDELVVATLDLDEITRLKEKWDFLPDRRPELYQALVQK